MVDMCLCFARDCSIKSSCWRYTHQSKSQQQSMSDFSSSENKGKCKHHIQNDPKNKQQMEYKK